MSKGVFQTSREIFDSPIWSDVAKFRIFFYIYGNAVFAEEGVTVAGVFLKRGQYLRSYRNLQEDLAYIDNRSIKKYSLSLIKSKIDQLVKEKKLKIESAELGTLFTVVNYESYQGFKRFEKTDLERQKNAERTQSERRENNNKNVNNVFTSLPSSKFDNNINARASATAMYEKAFPQKPLNEFIAQSIAEWINAFDGQEEIVCLAIKNAAEYSADNFKYVENTLKRWKVKGVKTVEDAQRVIDTFNREKERKFEREADRQAIESESAETLINVPLYNWVEDTWLKDKKIKI